MPSAVPHSHDHAASAPSVLIHAARRRAQRRLGVALGLALGVLALEVVGGLLTNSLALLADAGHVLGDAGAVGLALAALWMAGRPGSAQRTYGWHRAEVLAALVNALALFVLAGLIVWRAVVRIGGEPAIEGWGLLGVAVVGLAANAAAAAILHESRATSLNVRGAYLHVIGDALGSAAVIVAGVVVLLADWAPIDAIASLVIAVLIAVGGVRLLRETVDVLLEAAPRGIEVGAVAAEIGLVPGVLGVHDLHLWTVTSGFLALSAHLEVETEADAERVLAPVTRRLRDRFGIQHLTLQPETATLHAEMACCGFPDLPAAAVTPGRRRC